MTANQKASCPVETTLDVIGGKWKVLIIYFLLEGTHRFGSLSRKLGRISARTLTQQLRELEEKGLITREVFDELPQRVEYSISVLGRSLSPVLYAMADWGTHYQRECEEASTLEARRAGRGGSSGD